MCRRVKQDVDGGVRRVISNRPVFASTGQTQTTRKARYVSSAQYETDAERDARRTNGVPGGPNGVKRQRILQRVVSKSDGTLEIAGSRQF